MPSDEKVMHDRPEADSGPNPAEEDNATLTGAIEKAMEPVVKPFSEERPDLEAVEERRRAEDADERD